MKNMIVGLFVLLLNVFNLSAAEWNGSSDWDLFDCSDRRAMWLWNAGTNDAGDRNWDDVQGWQRGIENYKGSRDLMLDFCENKSIRVLYVFLVTWEWSQSELNQGKLPLDADFADLVADAHARGIQVWVMGYLWDNINDSRMTEQANKEAVKKILIAIDNFNATYPESPIAGYHNDQEPGDISVYDDLLDTMRIGQDWIDANNSNLLLSQALRPTWRNDSLTWNNTTRSMNEHLIDIIDHGAYMAYNDNMNTVMNWSNQICDYAANVGKKVAIGLETTYLTWSTSETWYDEIQAEPQATRFKVDAEAPITFEDGMHQAADELRSNAGFDRMAIHSYAAYFKHWFGMAPRDYILSQPGGEYDSETTDPAAVDVSVDSRSLVSGDIPADDSGEGDSDKGGCSAGTAHYSIFAWIILAWIIYQYRLSKRNNIISKN